MVRYLIKNALIVTLDPERRIIKDGAIAIDRKQIVDVGKTELLTKKFEPEETIDAGGYVVLPGFVDSHTHVSAEQLVRGFVPDNLSVAEWIFDWIARIYAAVTEEDEYYSTLFSCIEAIKTGTTTFCDGGSIHNLGAAARAMQHTGIRGVIGPWVWDIPSEPLRMKMPTEDSLRRIETAVTTDAFPDDRIVLWPMLIGEYPLTCSDELLVGAKKLADQHGLGLSMHQSTDLLEVEESIKRTGKRPVEHFEELEILGNNLRLVHMIHVSDREIELLKQYDVKVVHSPTAALRSGYGATKVGKFPEMLARGVNVSLGCDGANSSNHIDMVRAMYLAATIYKDSRMDTNMVPAETALEMATINGARSIMQEDRIGSIEVGKRADLIFFNRKRPEWVPMFNVINSLVYSADGKSVDTVFIDGELVLKSGRMTKVNEEDVYERVQKLGNGLIERCNLPLKTRWPTI